MLRLSQTRRQRFADGNSVTVDGVGLTYDASGNMTNDGNNTLVYDSENHAVSATNGGASGTYTYDGNNLRVKKVSGSTTTVYIFSGSKVIAEYDNGAAAGSPSREYIYSGGALLAKIDSSGTKYYHQDHLSNRLVTDSSGNTSAQLGHFPFGESWYNSTNDKLLFTSYERDSESGNDYALMRYNVNRLGRFSSPDPLGGSITNPQSLNRYPYVLNSPLSFADPLGLDCAYVSAQETQPCDLGGGIWGFAGANLRGEGCSIDGMAADCRLAGDLLNAGAGAVCPNNNCYRVTLQGGTFSRYVWVGTSEITSPFSNCTDDATSCQGPMQMITTQGWGLIAIGQVGPFDSRDSLLLGIQFPGNIAPEAKAALQAAKQATRKIKPPTKPPSLRPGNWEPQFKWINEKAKFIFDLIEDILDNSSGEMVVPFFINPSPCGALPSLQPSGPSGGCT